MSNATSPSSSLAAHDPWAVHGARIVSIRPEVPGIATYELKFDDPAIDSGYRFAPGQFNMMYLPGIGESAISISSDPDCPGRLLHTVRVVGNVTRALARLHVGDQVLLRGPFGSAWPVSSCEGCDVVLAAGGVGLAPLRPVIYAIRNQREKFGRVILLYGSRTPNDLLYTDEYDSWREAGIEVEPTVDLGDEHWNGHIGVVPVLFYRLRLDAQRTRILTCGPEVMMHFVVFEALARKVSEDDIYVSMERNMNCAVGMCGHCQLGPEFVCKDGPVFSFRRMEPYLRVEDF